MKSAFVPDNEVARLAALYDYAVLDSADEQAFDQLTELASSVCATPIALVSFVDEHRQWFKSHYGLSITESSRDIGFCAHTILEDNVFEVENSHADERFSDNPLTIGPHPIIFYAGAPLITPDGLRIGTLCVIDNKPSRLSELQKKQLQIIAKQVIAQLELRKYVRRQNQLLLEAETLSQLLTTKNKELEHFVHAVSHDLRAPLVTISGFTSTLAKELLPFTNAKQQHRFERISQNVAHMGDLLTQLLQLSRVMNGEVSKEVIDIGKLLEERWQGLSVQYKTLDVDFLITQPLQPIYANYMLLSQCIDNLLVNALRYRNPMHPLQIKVHTIDTESITSIVICDNGIGIDKSNHQRIFHVFEQVNTLANEGSGIGLSIVKAAMEKHNGKVNLISELGRGSCFELNFPKYKSP